jgi:hypothetical protein
MVQKIDVQSTVKVIPAFIFFLDYNYTISTAPPSRKPRHYYNLTITTTPPSQQLHHHNNSTITTTPP